MRKPVCIVPVALVFLWVLNFCVSPVERVPKAVKGSLFIIGGGSRPPEMVRDMLRLSGTDTAGYIMILPLASSEPDTSFYYAGRQFRDEGIVDIRELRPGRDGLDEEQYAMLSGASLIYLPGGSQGRFLDSVRNTNTVDAIFEAYRLGAMIAGTSAGAAVQSRLMITGDQRKHPEYTGYFETIEADNMILEEGLGLIGEVIIDQHFIKRQRLNRLIAVVLENPGYLGVGIDESTAIHVEGDSATVYGESQVVVINHRDGQTRMQDGLLGGRDLKLSVVLPGERFGLK